MILTLTPSFIAVALAACFFYGISKGGFNGAGMASMPLMALVIDPLTAAAFALPILLAQDAFSVKAFYKKWQWEAVIRLIPSGLLGIVFGAFFVSYVQNYQIKFAVGLIAVVFSLHYWFGGSNNNEVNPHNTLAALFWGSIAGFTSFFVHAGGTPFNIYLLKRGLDKISYAGSTALFFAFINVSKIPSYIQLGTLTWDILKISAIFIPFALLCNMLGVWLLKRVSQESFRKIIVWLTFIAGLKLLYDAVF